ncbi:MAG: hypothetical protein JXO72_16800 [Vicinamibacteria bacterium]|nr:hypothetical protein [Vicinamibacteria bacterium]
MISRTPRTMAASPLLRASVLLAIATSLWFVVIHAPVLHNHSDSDSGSGCVICQMLANVTPDLPIHAAAPLDTATVEAKCLCVSSAVYEQLLLDDSASSRGPPSPSVFNIIS